MKITALRANVLRMGMTCFLFAMLACLSNILFFPYARNLFNMSFPRFFIIYAIFFFVLYAASHFLNRVDAAVLERWSAWIVPTFVLSSLVLMLICGFLLAHKPFCDNAYVFKGAELLNRHGKITPEQDNYIYKYLLHFPNQWGFVLLLSLLPFDRLTSWFGANSVLYVLSGIQSLLFSASFFALLHTVKKRFGVRAQLMLVFCLGLFLPHYSASAVLYTDTFSMPFVVFALCCMLCVEQSTSQRQLILSSIGCGISLLIGCMIKMTCLILFLAVIIVWLLTLRPKRAAVCILIPLLILFSGTKAVNHHMANRVFNPHDAARYETPLLHWVMMSIPTENNRYGSNTNDYDDTWALMEQGASRDEIMQSIFARMNERLTTYESVKDVIYAAICKNANYVGDGVFGMWEMLDDDPIRKNILSSVFLYYEPYYPLYADICGGIWLAHMTMATLVCLKDIRKSRFSLSIPMIAFLGLLIFELVWEARSRYIFNFVPLILLISACGMTRQEMEK